MQTEWKRARQLLAIVAGGLFLNVSVAVAADARTTNWVALQVDDQLVTAGEVRQYIDAVMLSSDLHRTLFEQAGRNFEEYQSRRNQLVDELFPVALDRLAALRVLQAKGTKGENRRFFTLTREQWRKAVADQVSASVRTSRSAFVASLRESGFPHAAGSSDEAVYSAWLERTKVRLKEEIRQREASRVLCRMGNCARSRSLDILRQNREALGRAHFLVLRPNADEEVRGPAVLERVLAAENVELDRSVPLEADGEKLRPEIFLGRIVGERFEFLHINDWNLWGPVGTAIGYPTTDDYGRTSGFILRQETQGTAGSLSVQLENWLFTEQAASSDGRPHQRVEEEWSVRIASRHFLDESGQKWVVVGVSGTTREQQAGIGAWLQNHFHKLRSGSRERVNDEGPGSEFFLQGLVGVGGRYSILESSHVDLTLTGEALLAPAVGQMDQSSVQVRSSMELNIYGSSKEVPLLQFSVYSQLGLRAAGEVDTTVGGSILLGATIRKIQLQAGLFMVRWDGEMDRRYERGPSWTTGVMIAVSSRRSQPQVEYEF